MVSEVKAYGYHSQSHYLKQLAHMLAVPGPNGGHNLVGVAVVAVVTRAVEPSAAGDEGTGAFSQHLVGSLGSHSQTEEVRW